MHVEPISSLNVDGFELDTSYFMLIMVYAYGTYFWKVNLFLFKPLL